MEGQSQKAVGSTSERSCGRGHIGDHHSTPLSPFWRKVVLLAFLHPMLTQVSHPQLTPCLLSSALAIAAALLKGPAHLGVRRLLRRSTPASMDPTPEELAAFTTVTDIFTWLEMEEPVIQALKTGTGASTSTLRTWARIPATRYNELMDNLKILDAEGKEKAGV